MRSLVPLAEEQILKVLALVPRLGVVPTSLMFVVFAEDEELGLALLKSEKDRAEHIMLVDLARNDVNRVCQPATVKVDQLMQLQKYSHVIHLPSQVSGLLRDDKTRSV